jgi:hypothetical protein
MLVYAPTSDFHLLENFSVYLRVATWTQSERFVFEYCVLIPTAGSKILLAACRVLRRLLEAAFLPELGHKRFIACSRWRRCPGARASNFTKVVAFRRRHSLCWIVRLPTDTLKPPSS